MNSTLPGAGFDSVRGESATKYEVSGCGVAFPRNWCVHGHLYAYQLLSRVNEEQGESWVEIQDNLHVCAVAHARNYHVFACA